MMADAGDTLATLQRMDAEEPLFVRVLKLLEQSARDGSRGLSGREVAARLAVNPHSSIDCLQMLLGLGAVGYRQVGTAHLWHPTEPAVSFLRTRAR